MATMDVFNSDAFSLTSLSGLVNKLDYKPQMLGGLGIFEPMPVRMKDVFIDQRDGTLSLVQTTSRGSPVKELARDSRSAISFEVPRIAKGETLYSAEVASWRAFGTEDETTAVQTEFARRMTRVRDDMELTHEHMRLGALQGILLDADGGTIFNYFTEFNVTQPAAVSFELDVTTTDVAGICRDIKRSMERSSKGAMGPGSSVHALVGDDFFDALVTHPNVEKFWINWQAAAELRGIDPWSEFKFGGITFRNYRGTDDNTTVAVAAAEAKFFPVGARDVFKHIMAPADEFTPYIGAPGQSVYSINVRDTEYGPNERWVRSEMYSYPLFMCQRPEILRRGTLT